MEIIPKKRYWDKAWSLVDGCTPCSPGCDHCWSAGMTHRFKDAELTYCDPGNKERPRFTGKIMCHLERLDIPLKRKKPTVYAVWNDLFHEDVPWTFQNEVYGVMLEPSYHTYLIITKRPEQMLQGTKNITMEWPPNIYHGLTVCNQAEADEKIPIFLQVLGKKFLSVEPMLGDINLEMVLEEFQPLNPDFSRKPSPMSAVILGGETGHGARPIHLDWVVSVRNQCEVAGIPFFLKFLNKKDGRVLDGRTYDELPWS